MKTRLAAAAACCVGLLLSVGCVMPDQMSQIQKDLADVRHELRQVKREQAEARQKLAEVQATPEREEDPVTRAEVADLTVALQQVSRDVAVADERVNDLGRRMDRLVEDLARGRSQPLPPPTLPRQESGVDPVVPSASIPAATTAIPDPEALYNTAYTDFNKGNYALAISGFEEYVERFPDSALADNAAYWIGECHFSQGNFDEAVRAFDRMLQAYPASDKAAAGNLKKALAYLEQNQISQSIVQLHHVVSTYGGSDEAKIARDKLTSLGESL